MKEGAEIGGKKRECECVNPDLGEGGPGGLLGSQGSIQSSLGEEGTWPVKVMSIFVFQPLLSPGGEKRERGFKQD